MLTKEPFLLYMEGEGKAGITQENWHLVSAVECGRASIQYGSKENSGRFDYLRCCDDY